jgi:ubiquinone/menaquinone biosynthesis C-methylase UbiE
MSNPIIDYYDELAPRYDQDRFANTYGNYIHSQELTILAKYMAKNSSQKSLDVACGTGRFLDWTTHGVDASKEMLRVAQGKFPQKILIQSNADRMPFEDNSFDTIICFHLLMHLDKDLTSAIFEEFRRVLKVGGQVIFDVPSKHRRDRTSYQSKGWHGANSFYWKEIEALTSRGWQLKNSHGIGFFPIHRIPKRLRKSCTTLDTLFSNSPLKKYASYLVFRLIKT